MVDFSQESGDAQQSNLKELLLNWICGDDDPSTLSSGSTFAEAVEKYHTGTGEWLWDHEVFQVWFKAKGRAVTSLGLVAAPGAGKTVLAAHVASRLKDRGQKVVTFFCSFNDPKRRSTEFALRSIARQLLAFHDRVPDALTAIYERSIERQRSKLDGIDEAARAVEVLLKTIPRIHLIVDGIDELKDFHRESSWFSYLWKGSTINVTKWLITTRPDPHTRPVLIDSTVCILDVPEASVKTDIEQFLLTSNTFIDLGITSLKDLDLEVEANFLWAALLLDVVRTAEDKSLSAIRQDVKRLPSGLEGLYLRTLKQRLGRLKDSRKKLAEKLIAFLIAAEQPLHLSELTQALTMSVSSSGRKSKRSISEETIDDVGSHLIVKDTDEAFTDDPVVRFTHKTVYDFLSLNGDEVQPPAELRTFFTNPSKAHAELGKACFAYINDSRYDNPGIIKDLLDQKEHAFLRYAAVFWHHHLDQATEVGSQMRGQLNAFMEEPRFWTCIAVQSRVAPFIFGRYQRSKRGYNYSSGHNQGTVEASTTSWGCPLPKFVVNENAKALLNFIIQWHQCLNSHPDHLEQCYMGEQWEAKWPAFRRWIINCNTVDSSLVLGPIPFEREDALTTPCVLLSQIYEAELLDQDEWLAGRLKLHSCPKCASSDGKQAVSVINSSAAFLQDGAMTRILLETARCRFRSLNANWQIDDIGMNSMLHQTTPLDAVAVSFRRVPDAAEISSSQSDADSGYESDADETDMALFEYRLAIIRKSCAMLLYSWHAPASVFPRCAYDAINHQILWTTEPGQLCVLDASSDEVKTVPLEEPEGVSEAKLLSAHREVRLASNGSLMWYLLCTTHEPNRPDHGWHHQLHLTCFQVSRHEGMPRLEKLSRRSIDYYSTGSIRLPGILTAWSADHIYVALPPHASMAKILRLALTTETTDEHAAIDTLSRPILFPSSTTSRLAVLSHTRHNSTDMLTLHLAAESYIKHKQSCKLLCEHEAGAALPSMRGDDTLQDGLRQITWQVNETDGWRPWDETQDGQSQDYKKKLSATPGHLRGTYVDLKKSFRVTIRTSLDWRQQAFLSCM